MQIAEVRIYHYCRASLVLKQKLIKIAIIAIVLVIGLSIITFFRLKLPYKAFLYESNGVTPVYSVIPPIYPQYLWDLIECESSGRSDIKILDSNGYYSYGLLQWQENSFWYYNEKYKILPDLEKNEV